MSNNDNGFPRSKMNYTSDIPYISEGAVVGITIGWIVGIIGFYVLGMLIIKYYFKKFPEGQKSSKPSKQSKQSSQPKHRKGSSSSQQPAAINLGLSNYKVQQEKESKRRRKVYQENQTLQMLKITQQNQTYKNISNSKQKKIKQNLSLDERVEHQN